MKSRLNLRYNKVMAEPAKTSSKAKEKTIVNKKTTEKQVKKILKSQQSEVTEIKIQENINPKDNSTINTNDNEEVIFSNKKDEIDLSDDINNARKKRRRSSASIE